MQNNHLEDYDLSNLPTTVVSRPIERTKRYEMPRDQMDAHWKLVLARRLDRKIASEPPEK